MTTARSKSVPLRLVHMRNPRGTSNYNGMMRPGMIAGARRRHTRSV